MLDAFLRVQEQDPAGLLWTTAPASVAVLGEDQLAALAGADETNPWVGYAKHGIGQLVSVSPAAFNAALSEAVVYYIVSVGDGGGRGMVARLVREASVWRVTGTVMVWIE